MSSNGQYFQFQTIDYITPSPESLKDFIPEFHTPSFYAFSASPSPTFDDSLQLPESGTTSQPASSSISKSPQRLRSGNRVSRPRNAFMIFRSEFWAGEKITRSVEHDHRHISRIIGHCWNQLPDAEKDKWRQKAEQEKLDHFMKYPGYRFTPSARAKKAVKRKVKRNSEEELLRCKQIAELLLAGKQGIELDSAVKNMKSPLDSTTLKERKQERDKVGSSRRSRTSSPKTDQLQRQSESPPIEGSSHLPALDHIDIPIFRSPLLPPTETPENISPINQIPSSFSYATASSSYESSRMTSQHFHLPSLGGFCFDEGSQQAPAYFPGFPSFDGYSLSPEGSDTTQHRSEEQTCPPYYNYETVPHGFYDLPPSRTSPLLGPDPSAYSAMFPTLYPQTPLDSLMWDFPRLSPA